MISWIGRVLVALMLATGLGAVAAPSANAANGWHSPHAACGGGASPFIQLNVTAFREEDHMGGRIRAEDVRATLASTYPGGKRAQTIYRIQMKYSDERTFRSYWIGGHTQFVFGGPRLASRPSPAYLQVRLINGAEQIHCSVVIGPMRYVGPPPGVPVDQPADVDQARWPVVGDPSTNPRARSVEQAGVKWTPRRVETNPRARAVQAGWKWDSKSWPVVGGRRDAVEQARWPVTWREPVTNPRARDLVALGPVTDPWKTR
jgi:hypothetical protein